MVCCEQIFEMVCEVADNVSNIGDVWQNGLLCKFKLILIQIPRGLSGQTIQF